MSCTRGRGLVKATTQGKELHSKIQSMQKVNNKIISHKSCVVKHKLSINQSISQAGRGKQHVDHKETCTQLEQR